MLLAIDTSTQLAGLALYDGEVRAELTWVAGRRHSAELFPEMERLLKLTGLEVGALRAIAAARGPGSFTGVRVGLAAAQGLSLALDVPAYGVCTLDALAASQEASALPLRPLLEAGRNRFATALYERRDDRIERSGDIIAIELGDLAELVDRPCLICGDLNAASRDRLRAMLGERAVVASAAASLRRPGFLAQLGWEQYSRGAPGHPTALEPLYLAR
jgi:tRNA threonylcarbamoyladenosine biosynthesis protein TsaB